jgi:outer membrane protein
MRRSATRSLIIIVMFAALVSIGFAQANMKVGVVNSQEVLEKSAEGKKVMSQLEERNQKSQNELARMDEEIRKLQTRMNTQRLTLTQEALAQLSSDIERRQTERKRFGEDQYREMQDLTARLFQRVQDELLPIIEGIGKEKGVEIIFDLFKSGAIYFSPTIDLTQDVITRYDASKAK